MYSKANQAKRFIKVLFFIIVSSTISPNAIAESGDYLIGAGDVVKINVFDYPDLSIETRVSESGRITFPLLGEVLVGGQTSADVERIIASELSNQGFVKKPQVTLIVSEFVSQQVSILGYVVKPGSYTLEKQISLLELLAVAGGVAPEGDDKAILTRSEMGKSKSIEVDLYALFHGDLKKDMQIKANDIVYVPKSNVFYIYGEVQHPGVFRLQRNMNVAQAISAGGGLTPEGSDSSIKIKRRQLESKFDTKSAELGDLVQPDDVVYVSESWF